MHTKHFRGYTMRKIGILLIAILISGCYPDDSARYAAISRQTAIENTAHDLRTSAQNLSGWLVSSKMKRKALLSDDGNILSDNPNDFTVQNNPKPNPPTGIAVSPCGEYGAIAYFTSTPQGIGNLLQQGNAMAASLARKFGPDSVGMKMGHTVQLPRKGIDLGCAVGNDIMDGSPIFVAGFLSPNGMNGFPDPSKTTEPVFIRDITVPCPTGTAGVIKREQVCHLKSKDNETTTEPGTIVIGDTTNNLQRMTKTWECTPNLSTPLSAPTNSEVSTFCRDPANDIEKVADDAVAMQVINIKDVLEKNDPNAYYTFFCRKNKDGSNTCDAKPYTPPPETYLKCDRDSSRTTDTTNPPPPEPSSPSVAIPQFVVNPQTPLRISDNGELIGDANAVTSCGRGWYGKMTARYLMRRCQLMRTESDGSSTLLSSPQTIYRIGYAQAQCERDLETTVACPAIHGSNPNQRLPVMRHVRMLKPVALDWSEYSPSPGAWDTARIAGTDSRAEVLLTAGSTAPNKPPAVVPAATRGELDYFTDDRQWSEKLVDAMRAADPTSIEAPIVSCNNAGDPCGIGVPNNNIEIWMDTYPLEQYSGTSFEMPNLICSTTKEPCNLILGFDQPSICGGGGQCVQPQQNNPDGIPSTVWISGGNFTQLLNDYFEKVSSPLPSDNKIVTYPKSASLPMFNDPNVLCELASTLVSRLILFGDFNESVALEKPVECAALPGRSYIHIRDLQEDAVKAYRDRGGDLLIFSNHLTLGNEGKPVHHNLNTNDFQEAGLITQTLANWLITPIIIPNPCMLIN